MPLVLLFATACLPAPPESAVFSGVVRSGTAHDGPGLADATLTSIDPDGKVVATATSDTDGLFEVEIPWSSVFAVVIEADGHVPTSMSGLGTTEQVLAPDGAVFARSESWWDEQTTLWQGCEGLADGPWVEGILRAYLPVPGDEVDTLPVVKTGELTLDVGPDAFAFPCYLDDAGAFNRDAAVTGDTGRFLFADAPPGWSVVRPTFTAEGAQNAGIDQAVWIPESGVVSLDPAFVDTPGL